MAAQQAINVASIFADLSVDSTNLERGLANGRKALDAINREISTLQKDMRQGAIDVNEFANRFAALERVQNDIAAAMHAAYQATNQLHTGLEIVNANANQMTGTAGRLAFGIMQVGYAVDDLQYGFQAIVNNIAPMIYGFTGNAGIATAAQITAAAAYQLYAHWDDLTAALEGGIPAPALEGLKAMEASLKAVKKEMEELREKTALTREAFANFKASENFSKGLTKSIKEEKAVEKLEGGSKDDRKRGSAFTDAVREQGGLDAVRRELEAEYTEQAKAGNVKFSERRTNRLLQDAGIANESGHLASGFMDDNWIANDTFNREKLGAFAGSKGMKFDFDEMDRQLNAKGSDPLKIIRDQIQKQLAVADSQTGEVMTPEALARRRLAEGAAGTNKDSIKEVEDIINKKHGRETVKAGIYGPELTSEFSKAYDASSPEGKQKEEDAKQRLENKKNAEAKRKKDEAAELRDIDQRDRDFEKSNTEWARHKRQVKQEREENVRNARKQTSGIDKISEFEAMKVRLSGGTYSPQQAQAAIAEHLKVRGGLDEKHAAHASGEILKEADKKIEENLIENMLGDSGTGGKRKPLGKVEQFNASDVAARFQNSVGGAEEDESKKQTGLMEKMQESLEKMAQAGVVNVRIAKK